MMDRFCRKPFKLRLTAFTNRIKRPFNQVAEKEFDRTFQSFRRMEESAESSLIPE